MVFLSDYDMLMAEHLVQGVDVWINTPRRPWEASGTSGMKVLVNGGLNVSELDGWWAEAYAPELGWALGDGQEHGDDPSRDAAEANQLYELLEREIVPQFYTRDSEGIPTAWVARIRESMSRLTPQFSANRVVRQYTQDYYLPAAAAYRARAAQNGAMGRAIADWQRMLRDHWGAIRFGKLNIATNPDTHTFELEIHLGAVPGDCVHSRTLCQWPKRQRRNQASNGTDPHSCGRGQQLCVCRECACKQAGSALHPSNNPASRRCRCAAGSSGNSLAAINRRLTWAMT